MTTTTVAYLWRSRTGLKEHSSVFSVIWTVMWASAAPPLILMIVAIVDGYMTKSSSHPTLIIAVDITGKIFVLSLMINLCGRNIIQEALNRVQAQAGPFGSHNRPVSSLPVVIRQEKAVEYELHEWPNTARSPGIEPVESRSDQDTKRKDHGDELGVDGRRLPSEELPAKSPGLIEETRISQERYLSRQV